MKTLNLTKQMTEVREIKAYQDLSNAVITSAFKDLIEGNIREQQSAFHFFEYGNFEIWADITGVQYGIIIDQFKKVAADNYTPPPKIVKCKKVEVAELKEKPRGGMTVNKVVKKYNIPKKTVQYYGYRKNLPAAVKFKGIYYFFKTDVETMIECEKSRKGSKYYVK